MEQLRRDLQFGLRLLVKNPGLSLIAILTFSLGIGLTTTVFSIVNGALFKGLPFDEGHRVIALGRNNPSQDIDQMGVTVHDLLAWREQQTTMTGLAASGGGTVNLVGAEGRPERYSGSFVTANAFDVLRVQPVLGRAFREGEDRPGAEKVIILGYEVWQEVFDGAPDVLGRTVRTNGEVRTVVGVAPHGFQFPSNQELWLPLELDPNANPRGDGPNYLVFGRLKDGVTLNEAGAEFATIASRLAEAYPESNEGVGTTIEPFTKRFLGDEVYGLLYTMLGAVLGVLLIACANVANLLLARASVRSREVAVRSALGASRRRVVMQLLTEVLVLSIVGATLGLALGFAGVRWFEAAIAIDPPPFWITFDPDIRVMLFVLGTVAFTAIFSGLVPAFRATGANVSDTLKDEGRGASSFRMGRFSSALVIAEVAVSCGLLIAAGLMTKSVVQLKTLPLPFTTERIFTARLNLPALEYPDTANRVRFYDQLLPRLGAVPGVEAATLSDGLPASGNGSRVFEVDGRSYATDQDFPFAREGIVTPGYFDTFQAEVLQGRVFTVSDHAEATPVAVVNRTFVREFFPDGDALGRRIRMGRRDTTAQWLTVVGVVPDMRMEGIGNNDESPAGFYIPIAQSGVGNFVSIALRTRGEPTAVTTDVRAAVTSIDPNLPIYNVFSMRDVIAEETWFYGVFGTLFMVFGFVALFLAAVGLYGVMSFAVSRRTQEMGIRMALGADAPKLVGLVMRRGLMQLIVGMALGLALAFLATTPLEIVLFEVNARDPIVFGIVVLALAVTGVLATFVPARRVTRLDPVMALSPE
jgi:predicted permease